MDTNDNSLKSAENLLEVIKSKMKDRSLKLLNHNYKRKYVESYVLRDYDYFKIIEDKCRVEQYTSESYGENEGLNRDGWKFIIVGRVIGCDYELTQTFKTWFKNRHGNYGTLILQDGWNSSPYLNINNFGVEFELPTRVLIKDWIDPELLPQNKINYLNSQFKNK